MAGSPRIIARPTTRSPAACRRARVRQGQAFGGAEEAPSLTAAARRRRPIWRSGRKNASRRGVEQKNGMQKTTQNGVTSLLTKKAPYKPNRAFAAVRRPLAEVCSRPFLSAKQGTRGF